MKPRARIKEEVAADVKGKLAMYMVKATRRGLAEQTISNNAFHITWLSSQASRDEGVCGNGVQKLR